jgi:hypothetical protein
MNKKNKKKNQPNDPTYNEMSQTEGVYSAQEDGRKSRCKLRTIITQRSNHMPILIKIEMIKIAGRFVRIRFDHNSCGMMILHPISVQYDHAYGPIVRLVIRKASYKFALYHA